MPTVFRAAAGYGIGPRRTFVYTVYSKAMSPECRKPADLLQKTGIGWTTCAFAGLNIWNYLDWRASHTADPP